MAEGGTLETLNSPCADITKKAPRSWVASRWDQRGNNTEDSRELGARKQRRKDPVSGFLETRIMDGSSVSGR